MKKKLDEMERRFNEGDILGNKDFFRKKPWYITEKVEIIRYTRLKSMYSSHVGEIAEAWMMQNICGKESPMNNNPDFQLGM